MTLWAPDGGECRRQATLRAGPTDAEARWGRPAKREILSRGFDIFRDFSMLPDSVVGAYEVHLTPIVDDVKILGVVFSKTDLEVKS